MKPIEGVKLWRIWCLEISTYPPFSFEKQYPVLTEVEIEGEYELGKGFEGYLIVAPNKQTFVCDAESGAIIGTAIREVRDQISKCNNIEGMKKQVADAIKLLSKGYKKVQPVEFWEGMKCA